MDKSSSVIRSKVNQKCIETFHKRIKKDMSNKEENKKEEWETNSDSEEKNYMYLVFENVHVQHFHMCTLQ